VLENIFQEEKKYFSSMLFFCAMFREKSYLCICIIEKHKKTEQL